MQEQQLVRLELKWLKKCVKIEYKINIRIFNIVYF